MQQILERSALFRGRACRITSIYRRYREDKCFRVDVEGDAAAYKVRWATDTARLSPINEYQTVRLVHARGVRGVAEVCEYVADAPSYVVTRFIDGRSLDSGDWWIANAGRIRDQLQRRIGDLHAIAGTFHGHVAGPHYASWRDFLAARLRHHLDRCARESILSPDSILLIERLYADVAAACEGIEPRLLHGDVKPANIVVTPAGDCHLVDYEAARFGDPDFEWVKLFWLGLRWPEYRRHLAEPLLEEKLPSFDPSAWPAKLLLYAVYCAVVPSYRFTDLGRLLDVVRSRFL